MTRREAREQAFQILFEQAVRGEKIDDILHDATEARDFIPNSFAESVVYGVEENRDQIDMIISQHLKGWSFRRLSVVTMAILRLATYEILYDEGVPISVSINEAVELAKTYGGKDDAPYVNGVLSAITKSQATGKKDD